MAVGRRCLGQDGGRNTIFLRPGVYRGPIEIGRVFAGTAQHPTVIRSEQKWKAVVIGGAGHCIANGDDCDWLVVDGFEVLGARYDGIKLNGDHNTVRNCWVHHNTQMGVSMHGRTEGTIENNLIEFNGCHVQFDHGVYASGDGLTVRGNIVRHNAGFGLHLYPSLKNSLIALNLVYGHAALPGVIVACPADGGRNLIVQNTIVGSAAALTIWTGRGEVIANNILVASGDPISLLQRTEHVFADYNLCWPKSQHDGPHGVSRDPLFLDPHHGLFWLRKESAAIGKGRAEYAPVSDFWGRPVPKDNTCDLGAFAFVPSLLDPQSRADLVQWLGIRVFAQDTGRHARSLGFAKE